MGERLAEKILRQHPEHDIDVVIPIPDTSRTSALELANLLKVKYREGFIKTAILGVPSLSCQASRNVVVQYAINPNAIDLEFHEKMCS